MKGKNGASGKGGFGINRADRCRNVFRRKAGVSGSICLGLAAALASVPLPRVQAEESRDRGVTINVYNWGEYIANGTDDSLDVNAEFTRRTGIRVNYTTFDSNESLYSKLVGGGADYDVIIPSDYMVSRLIDENMLAELDFSNIPNYQYIDESFRGGEYDPENRYSVPYTWGVVGLFYNTDYIKEEITSWSALWDDRYAGKILMFDNPRDAFAIAQFMLGQSVNTTREEDWQEAAALLKQQKPMVQAYVMDKIFDKMESEEAWTKEQVKQAKDALVLADPVKVTMPSNVDPDEWLKENTEWLVSVKDLNTLIKNADDRLKQVRDENNDTYKVYMQVSKDAYCAQLEEQKKAAESLVKTATARKPVNEQLNKLQEAYDKESLLAETAVVNELQKKITEALKDTGDYDKKHTDKTNKDHIGAFVYTQESRRAVEYAIAKLNELHGKLPLDTTQAMCKGVTDALNAFAAAKKGLVEVDYQLYDDAQKALDDAAKLKQEDYTGDSWKAYEATCQALKDLMPDLVTPDQLEDALDTISSARKELISIVDLRGVVEDYKVRYIQEQYTVNSWKDYTKVQAEAEAVLADPAAKADYISFMINKL